MIRQLHRLLRILEYPIWIIYGTFSGYQDDIPRPNFWDRFILSHYFWGWLVKNIYF